MAVLFARLTVKDLENFKSVHRKVDAAHARYGVTETVWQDADALRSLTIAIHGDRERIEAWLASPERAKLARELHVESASESWICETLFPEGEYGN